MAWPHASFLIRPRMCYLDHVRRLFKALEALELRFLYIRTIAFIMRTGAIWTNLGPLLYHYADVPHEISIELSWEEVRPYICKYFDFIEEEEKIARYTGNAEGLSVNRYKCIFFVACLDSKKNCLRISLIYLYAACSCMHVYNLLNLYIEQVLYNIRWMAVIG